MRVRLLSEVQGRAVRAFSEGSGPEVAVAMVVVSTAVSFVDEDEAVLLRYLLVVQGNCGIRVAILGGEEVRDE